MLRSMGSSTVVKSTAMITQRALLRGFFFNILFQLAIGFIIHVSLLLTRKKNDGLKPACTDVYVLIIILFNTTILGLSRFKNFFMARSTKSRKSCVITGTNSRHVNR